MDKPIRIEDNYERNKRMNWYKISQIEENTKSVEEAARDAGYNSPKLYHATRHDKFNKFDRLVSKNGFFFSDSPRNSEFGKNTASVYLSYNNPFIADSNGGVLDGRMYQAIENRGFDAIISNSSSVNGIINEYVVFKPEQIKSADPITYDDNGNEIPLNERFDKNNLDIRY